MRKWCALLALAAIAAVAVSAFAQEEHEMSPEMMKAMMPGEHHGHMAKLVGEYTIDGKAWMAPGQEPTTFSGTRSAKMILDGRFLQETVKSEFAGMPMNGIGILGYDNMAGQYQYIWIDNMSTSMMTAHGSCSEDGWALEGEHLDPASGEMVAFKNVLRPTDKGFVFEWHENNTKMMEINYVKK